MKTSFLKGQDSFATKPQLDYIDQLAIDLGFDRKRRNAHVQSIIEEVTGQPRVIDATDRLTKSEASVVIDRFKKWKESNKPMWSNKKDDKDENE